MYISHIILYFYIKYTFEFYLKHTLTSLFLVKNHSIKLVHLILIELRIYIIIFLFFLFWCFVFPLKDTINWKLGYIIVI